MSADTSIVHVELGERSYDIKIGAGVLAGVGEFVAAMGSPSHAAIITDENVQPLYAADLAEQITENDVEVHLFAVDAGEPSKCSDALVAMWEGLLAAKFDRKSVIISVGGGVVGDLAGMVAATFARGLDFLQVPTTLLAQVDSSVGGKVGINLSRAKNMVGAFWQPKGVLIDTDTLATLSDREYRAGLGEVVKYGMILDADFFIFLEQNVDPINGRDSGTLLEIITRCCRLKADVVENDERELTGLRAVLNYGHTFAHAIEAVGGYGELLHGEAVAIGMMCAARLASSLGRIDNDLVVRQHDLLTSLHLPTAVPELSHEDLFAAMTHDKKTEHGHLRFILPERLGAVSLVDGIDSDRVLAALDG